MSFLFNFDDDDDIDAAPNTTSNSTATTIQPTPLSLDTSSTSTSTSTVGSTPFRASAAPSIEILSPPVEDEGRRPELVGVRRHKVRDLLATLPSRIAYSATLVTSPQRERRAIIPRRALFDVRMQLMAESDSTGSTGSSSAASTPVRDNAGFDPDLLVDERAARRARKAARARARQAEEGREIGLGDSDIERNVYEGGFKSWEGAMDLARLVLERGPRKDLDELARVDAVVELGCGTALPSLVLFQHALANESSLHFTLADYNEAVLRLVTLPNLLLVWAMQFRPDAFDSAPPSLSGNGNRIENEQGDINLTPELLAEFQTGIADAGITLSLLSGPWSPPLDRQLTPPLAPNESSVLVLAAETIYSPASLAGFSRTLLNTLRRAKMSKAIIAAKRVYFGVGGSVDEFKSLVGAGGGVVAEVDNSGIEGCERASGGSGVGRCLLEVQLC